MKPSKNSESRTTQERTSLLFKMLVPLRLAVVLLLVIGARAQATEKVLYAFNGSDGSGPDSPVAFDDTGNLYSTTPHGGAFGYGTVFELAPSGGNWTESVLHSFNNNGVDGLYPDGGVIERDGDLYGTTMNGGSGSSLCGVYGCGVVFELSPSGGTWNETLVNFAGQYGDDLNPFGPLVVGRDGKLYGTSQTNAFQVSRWDDAAVITPIYFFSDVATPPNGLVFDGEGNLYGTTNSGGGFGRGSVYELSSASRSGDSGLWTQKELYGFLNQPDGEGPVGSLVFDKAGNLYGVTLDGGIDDVGTVFKLTRSNGEWVESVIYSFKLNGVDGFYPHAGVRFDGAGNLFGTTFYGGLYSGFYGNGAGTVYELRQVNGDWAEHVVYNFCSLAECSDGAYPVGAVAIKGGHLYGTASSGGNGPYGGYGVVFEVSP